MYTMTQPASHFLNHPMYKQQAAEQIHHFPRPVVDPGMVTQEVRTKGRIRMKNRNHQQMLSLFRTPFRSKTKQVFASHVTESVTSTNTHVYNDTASQSFSQPSNVQTTSSRTDSPFSKASSGSIPRSSINDNRILNCLYTNADSLTLFHVGYFLVILAWGHFLPP